MLALELVSGPDIEPVTLAEMRAHLREYADVTENDAQFIELIQAGREWVENYTQRICIDQTWRLSIGDEIRYCSGPRNMSAAEAYLHAAWLHWQRWHEIKLHLSPLIEILSFVTVGADGTETAVTADTYEVREAASKWPRLVPLNGARWGRGLYRVLFRTGFADRTGSPVDDASVVPARFKQAIKLYGEALYDRDPVMMDKLTAAAENVIRPERAALQIA